MLVGTGLLLVAALLGGCGGNVGSPPADSGASSSSTAPGVAAGTMPSPTVSGVPGNEATAPVARVEAAVRQYLEARDRALVPGGAYTELVALLCPGSPAAAMEPAVARGRAAVAADAGLCCAAAATTVEMGAGSATFYAGEQPVEPARAIAEGTGAPDDESASGGLRAVAVAAATTDLTWSDLSTSAVRQDHVLLLSLVQGRWLVYDDRYAEARLAEWLTAGGAGAAQVGWARNWAAQARRTFRLAATPESTVHGFVALLDRRRYPEANLLLDPSFGGTAQGMGMWLHSIRVVAVDRESQTDASDARLRVTVTVSARPSPWNDGENVRWFTMVRRTATGPWRISAIDSGP
jgi:hypothetical protein